ncbi:TonB-dependent receptor [uncultured Desulfuromonas sp.]|uniref:TonB-dependent receptor n=1 Tax=uncultured Desulfuromonas sp. TaxID=181013 RepID=UPI002AAB8432|nr:TonB-dependent receptor [uncultured Desulfuromonas sp.]
MKKLLCLFLVLTFAFTGYAEETTTLEDLTVTANKVEEDPQDLPVTLSVFSDVDINDKSIKQTEDIFQRVPNLHLTKMGPTGVSQNIASIRGITSFMTGGTVFGFYVDDVFQPSFDVNLLDVERIEVLRGPQGTLYGRNAEAGVINIITRKPENRWSADAGVSYGSYDTEEIFVAGNGALVPDKLFLRVSGQYRTSDGFYENTATSDDDVDEGTSLDTKLALTYKATPNLTADLKLNYQKYDANYAEFSAFDKVQDGDFEVEVDNEGNVERDFWSSALKLSYELASVRLTSITSALKNDSRADNDVDFTSAAIMDLLTGEQSTIYGQELRLNSTDETSALQWTSGIYLYRENTKRDIDFNIHPYAVLSRQDGETDKTGAALFGQADYRLGRFVLTAGLRYENEHQDFDYQWSGGDLIGYTSTTGSTDEDFDALMPKAAVSYAISDTVQTYVSVSRGFKSGGFNLSSEPGKSYDSEYTWNYELGLKSKLAHNRVRLNAALFYIDWTDLQVEQPSYPDYIVDNAAEATSKGFELDVDYLPAQWLKLYGSYGYVRAEFDKYTLDGVDYSDKRVPNAPTHTYALGATLRLLDNWFCNAEINGTGKIYYAADNDKEQTSYEIVNVKAGYETERFDIYVWAKNLFDEAYATRAFEMSGQWYARSGAPLTVGIDVNLRF